MEKRNDISYIYRLIRYFRSKEIVPSKDEEDKVWNNIMSEINASSRKHYTLNRWKISLVSLGAAAMLAGAVCFIQFRVNEKTPDLFAVYQSMYTDTVSSKIQILAENRQMADVDNDVTIDYSKSEKQVKLGEKVIDKPENIKYHQLVVPMGKHTCLILADGSVLHVNAATRVVYPDRFSSGRREIFVDGEIYIDVKRNEKAPFVVRTTSCDIEVLGTAFNVLAYSQDSNTEVALVRGAVKLTDKGNNEIRLNPDELALVSNNQLKGKFKVDASDYTSWTEGLLKLDATPLSSVFKRLERYYGAQIEYSEKVGRMRMYGSLDIDCPLDEVLRRIGYTAPVQYEKNNNNYVIKER